MNSKEVATEIALGVDSGFQFDPTVIIAIIAAIREIMKNIDACDQKTNVGEMQAEMVRRSMNPTLLDKFVTARALRRQLGKDAPRKMIIKLRDQVFASGSEGMNALPFATEHVNNRAF